MAMFDLNTWSRNLELLDTMESGKPVKCGYPGRDGVIFGRYISNQGSSNMYISTPHGTLMRFTLAQCDFDMTEEDMQKLKDFEKLAIEDDAWYLKGIEEETIAKCCITVKPDDIKPLE